MTPAPATLADLITALKTTAPDQPIRFDAPSGHVGAGAHITELKLADIDSIDCGGRRSHWVEAQVQILDGKVGRPLTAAKVIGILGQSIAAIPALADAPLSIEFGKDNNGLSRYRLGEIKAQGGVMQVSLTGEHAVCKPAVDLSCCGASSLCCA